MIIFSAQMNSSQGCTTCGSRAARKWRENEKMKRKCRENEEMERKLREIEEMERDSLSTFPHFLFISSLSIHFLYQKLSHFVAKCLIRPFLRECHKKLYIFAMRI